MFLSCFCITKKRIAIDINLLSYYPCVKCIEISKREEAEQSTTETKWKKAGEGSRANLDEREGRWGMDIVGLCEIVG